MSQCTGSEHRQMEKVFIGVLCGLHDDTPNLIAAARHLLDFIYLSHYPSHSTSTLAQMNKSLEDFHSVKQVFIDIGVREHFNIAKIHSTLHYISSIIDIGCLDGVNTEQTERLHIDYAKLGYRASNKKNYTQQMVTWLTRREKAHRLQTYLDWLTGTPETIPGIEEGCVYDGIYEDERPAVENDEENLPAEEEAGTGGRTLRLLGSAALHGSFADTPPPTSFSEAVRSAMEAIGDGSTYQDSVEWGADDELEDELDRLAEEARFGPYKIGKVPSMGYLRGAEIATLTGALGFCEQVRNFLRLENPDIPHRILNRVDTEAFGVFHQFKRILPSLRGLPDELFSDRVQARCATSKRSARYDTVLFVDDEQIADSIGVTGYRVGQVRAIFTLPSELQKYRPNHGEELSHLLYIEVFTRFTEEPEPYSKLYKISHDWHNQQRRSIVLPVHRVFRSCHLIPDWGAQVNRSWSSEYVLEQADTFFLNPFSDHHMFLFV